MTTNVFDSAAGILTSDSRWSFRVKDALGNLHAILYVDDTGFDKIEPQADYSFMFAGLSSLIDEWKAWIRSPNRVVIPRPGVIDDFAICMIETSTGIVKFEHGQKIAGSDHRFAGTGAYPAYQCWSLNKNAQRAVKSAYVDDDYSGGEVKFLELKSNKHNVNQAGVFKSINKLVLQRGMVMYKSTDKAVPVKDAAANDPLLKNFTDTIAKGGVSAEAPSGHDKIVWTDTDIERLDKALADCFGIAAK